MNLVIDIGNSTVKLAVFKNDKLYWLWSPGDVPDLKKFSKNDFSFTNSIVSSVIGKDDRLTKILTAKTRIVNFNHKTPLPFKNLYKTPDTLGLDRLASVAGAHKYFPKKNVLVIDAGTCIKYDFINSKSQYSGGSISPGLKMRFDALHKFTSRLPLIKPEPVKSFTGNTTKNSILTGVIAGVANEINGFIDLYKAKNRPLKVMLTGGDAKFLGRQLKSSIFAAHSSQVSIDSHLTLYGLHEILKYNVSKSS